MGNSGLALETVVPAARPNSIHCERIMAQKSITSFFMKKDVSSSNNETPTKPQNKEETKASAVPHSSPLKEPNRHEENSIDSPIKVTKKSKKKRLDSSSEEENGSPKSIKKESPQKSEPKKGAKRKSSPTATSNEKKAKKTKNVDEEEVKPSEVVSGDESMDEEEEGGGGISDSELDFL